MSSALLASKLPAFQDPRFSPESLRDRHPSDIADDLEESGCGAQEIVEVLEALGNPDAAEVFSRLTLETQKACFEAGPTPTLLHFVESMDPDDRVDLLKKVDPEVREAMLPLIAQAERNAIRRLWNYEEGTAGSVMTTEYAFLPAEITVREALDNLRLQAPNKETIYTVYIIDEGRHLQGVISLRNLIMSRPGALLSQVMETQVISVPHNMPEDEVAGIISKYDLIALPVVDHENRLLGIITVDDVIDIIREENTEDFHRISAVIPFEEQYLKRSLPRLFWSRFCWLAILLVTSLVSTTIMELNSDVLQKVVALAFFIPMVVGTCGNAGTQSATMVVRALALGEIHPRDFVRVFRRELLMGLSLGLALGMMACFRVFAQDHNVLLAMIVGSALFGTLLGANLSGALIPLALKRFGLDPALTAGPFIATIIDAAGILLYFQVAILILHYFQ